MVKHSTDFAAVFSADPPIYFRFLEQDIEGAVRGRFDKNRLSLSLLSHNLLLSRTSQDFVLPEGSHGDREPVI